MIRKFALENERSERYPLDNARITGLAIGPSGLGMVNEARYIQVGDHFAHDFLRNAQDAIRVTAYHIGKNAYQQYQQMVNFIMSASQLRLVYSVPLGTEYGVYYRDVDLSSIEKSEIQEYGRLPVPMVFNCTTLWYQSRGVIYDVETLEGETRYTMQYDMIFNDNSALGFDAKNNGHVPAAIHMDIEGLSEYPRLDIVGSYGEAYQAYLPAIVYPGDIMSYSSEDKNLYAYVQRANGTNENLLSAMLNIDGNDMFIKVPIGVSQIRLSSTTGVLARSIVRMLIFFRTV